MEAGDPAARQSGPPLGPNNDPRSRPTSVHHHAPYHPQQPLERPIRDHNGHSMAAASVLPPSSHYSTSHNSGYSASTQQSPVHKMMSSDPHKGGPLDKDPVASRQSLPSISDVLKVTEPRQYPSPAPSAMPSSSNFPSPYPQANTRNPYENDKHASPQGLHHPAFPPRQEPPPSAYAESSRSSFSSSRPPLPPVADRRPSPTMRPEIPPHHPAQEPPRHHEHPHHPHPAGYAPHEHAHPPPPPPPPPSQAYSHAPMPPGQYPLPGHPGSPRVNGPPGPHHPHGYDQRAPPGYPERAGYANSERPRHEPPSHYDNATYADALQKISHGGRTIFNVGEHYYGILSEQGGSLPPLSRLPSDIECADMLGALDMMKRSWEQIRDIVQDAARNERSMDVSRPPKHAYDDDDMMYRDGDMKAPGYAEPKKQRRGRAAPPGRCHSCNRIDTPEWRRGPDGARTLCNACGLHYAKLERKRQLEQKQQAQQQAHRPRHE